MDWSSSSSTRGTSSSRVVRAARSDWAVISSIPHAKIFFCLQGLYDEHQSSMDELGGFEPSDTTGFIQIESIRIKK